MLLLVRLIINIANVSIPQLRDKISTSHQQNFILALLIQPSMTQSNSRVFLRFIKFTGENSWRLHWTNMFVFRRLDENWQCS
jgi:hypothetical protein